MNPPEKAVALPNELIGHFNLEWGARIELSF